MRVIEHNDVKRFSERVMPLLLRAECENGVMIGILGRLVEGKPATKSGQIATPILLTVEDGDALHAVAIQTPPHALLFTPVDDRSAALVAEHLDAHRWDGAEFVGMVPCVRSIARRWSELTGRDFKLRAALTLFRTSRVIDPIPSSGSMRLATLDDAEILSRWVDEFGQEIGEPFLDAMRATQMAIDERRLHVWIDEAQPRSICAWQGPTPSSVRIGLVYTPPALRGRGYASSAVAELTRRMLTSGRKYCTLFTDKSNPTSNRIYQKIGFEPVADFEHVKFEGPAR